jgi:hypothetical protein
MKRSLTAAFDVTHLEEREIEMEIMGDATKGAKVIVTATQGNQSSSYVIFADNAHAMEASCKTKTQTCEAERRS